MKPKHAQPKSAYTVVVKMGLISFLSLGLLLAKPAFATEYDESINHAPGFQIYQYDPKLKELVGEDGTDHLCWPSALTHRLIYFQRYRNPGFPRLHLDDNIAVEVREVANQCHTSFTGGTSQRRKLPCIRQFLKKSGYNATVYAVGPASTEARYHRAVQVKDLLDPLRIDYGVILHVGWLRYDPKTHAWIEKGSHSLNGYGFSYNRAWGGDKIILQVANPGVDYSKRASRQMYDSIEVKKLTREPGVSYPAGVDLVVSGPGFDFKERLAVLEDLFVFYPEQK